MSERVEETSKHPSFDGLSVISFESRRAMEMTKLIENHCGVATVVPAMREIAIEKNPEALAFERALLAGEFDVVVFMTGVGTRMLLRDLETRLSREDIVAALARTTVVARGPKSTVALREYGVPVTAHAPPPNTWREVLAALDEQRDWVPLSGRRVAIQEYGMTNRPLIREMKARGATVTRVPVYRWALPEDLSRLFKAVNDIIDGYYDVVLFTTGTQVWHVFKLAVKRGMEEELRQGFGRMVVASVGPTTSEALREWDVAVDIEPEHPKMGHLVKQAALHSGRLLADKRLQRIADVE
jgi:uroporphyrinogen-III synthase